MKKYLSLVIALFFLQNTAHNYLLAQLPDTDIYLMSMKNEIGTISFGEPENITHRVGYDNQPCFDLARDMMYYTAYVDSLQSDIYVYNIPAKKSFQLTHTKESEYSPTPLRGDKYVACVRVDKDSTQHLYTYVKSGNFPANITPHIDSVGYFCWVDSIRYALFILGEKYTLQIYNTRTGSHDTIATDIGRCIQNIPSSIAISYTQKTSDTTWTIMRYENFSKTKSVICKSLIGSEDYAWTPDQKIISGKDGKLFMYDTKSNEGWKQIADFSKSIGSFYRIAVNKKGDWIAVVGFKGKKP